MLNELCGYESNSYTVVFYPTLRVHCVCVCLLLSFSFLRRSDSEIKRDAGEGKRDRGEEEGGGRLGVQSEREDHMAE